MGALDRRPVMPTPWSVVADRAVATRPGVTGNDRGAGRTDAQPFAKLPPGGWSWNATALPAGTASGRPGPAGSWWVRSSGCAVIRGRLRPVTVDADELLHAVRGIRHLARSYLLSQRLDVDQQQMVTMAADHAPRTRRPLSGAAGAGVRAGRVARVVGDSAGGHRGHCRRAHLRRKRDLQVSDVTRSSPGSL